MRAVNPLLMILSPYQAATIMSYEFIFAYLTLYVWSIVIFPPLDQTYIISSCLIIINNKSSHSQYCYWHHHSHYRWNLHSKHITSRSIEIHSSWCSIDHNESCQSTAYDLITISSSQHHELWIHHCIFHTIYVIDDFDDAISLHWIKPTTYQYNKVQ